MSQFDVKKALEEFLTEFNVFIKNDSSGPLKESYKRALNASIDCFSSLCKYGENKGHDKRIFSALDSFYSRSIGRTAKVFERGDIYERLLEIVKIHKDEFLRTGSKKKHNTCYQELPKIDDVFSGVIDSVKKTTDNNDIIVLSCAYVSAQSKVNVEKNEQKKIVDSRKEYLYINQGGVSSETEFHIELSDKRDEIKRLENNRNSIWKTISRLYSNNQADIDRLRTTLNDFAKDEINQSAFANAVVDYDKIKLDGKKSNDPESAKRKTSFFRKGKFDPHSVMQRVVTGGSGRGR